MASLVLGAVGAVVGSAIGGPTGAAWGWNLGSLAGGILFPPNMGQQSVGKLDDLRLSGSGYGSIIPQIWGKVRIGGVVIWETQLNEHITSKKQKGKGGTGNTVKTYTYTASFAVAVCKGPATVLRIWAEDLLIYDSTATPTTKYNITFYDGGETQTADPLMESIIGSGIVPAFRGTNYVVFDELLLTDWGNRLPNLSFEVTNAPKTLENVLTDLSEQVGISSDDFDYSAATDTIDGFVLAQRGAVRDLIDPLLQIYATDITEFGGKIKAIKRGGDSVLTLTQAQIGAVSTNTNKAFDAIQTKIITDIDLPQRLDLTYFSIGRLYQQMTQTAVRQIKDLVFDSTTLSTLLVLDDDFARQAAERLIYTYWLERTTFTFALTIEYLRIGPGNILMLPINGESTRVRIIERDLGLFGEIKFIAVRDESDVLIQTINGGTSPVIVTPVQTIVNTDFVAWSCPILRDEDRTFPGFYVAATGPQQWIGCIVYYSTDGGTTYVEGGIITDRTVLGVTTTAIPDASIPEALDTTSTLGVLLTDTGDLESTSQINVEMGDNASLVGDEVLGFATATNTGALAYNLTNLTRGFLNSDMTGHVIGEKFVVLDDTMIRVDLPWSLVGTVIKVKCVSDGQTIGSVMYEQDITICDPTEVSTGGRSESWIVQASDPYISNSNRTYTRTLQHSAKPGSIWLAVRRLMREFSSIATLSLDAFGNPTILSITFPVGSEFLEGDEIDVWYEEVGSLTIGMKTVKTVVSVAGTQNLTIPETPVTNSVRLWLRNQWLSVNAYTVTGTAINIPNAALDIESGDIIFYAYTATSDITAVVYAEDDLIGVDGQQNYTALGTPAMIGGNPSFVADVGGVVDPSATCSGTTVTLAVDMTHSTGIPVTIRRYS